MEISGIKLLGERRVKALAICMLVLLPCLLFFLTLAISLEMPSNLTMMVLIYVVFGLLFLFGVYLLFNTTEKLITANIFVSLCFGTLSVIAYGVFLYVTTDRSLQAISKGFVLYLIACVITEIVLFKIRYFDFKKTEKMSDSFWVALLGVGIGKAGYQFVKSAYGEDGSNLIGIISCFLSVAIFGFMSLFFFNKYYIVSRYGPFISIDYIE